MLREIVQIQVVTAPAGPNWGEHVQVYAFCNDGSLWVRYEMSAYANLPDGWHRIESIPQGEK